MPPVEFDRENFVDMIDEAWPILQAQWFELNINHDIPLALNRDKYRANDEAGLIRIYTARIGGELVGYVCFIVSVVPRYDTSPPQALQDVIYVENSARGAGIGRGLVRYAEAALKAEGAQVVYHHVKVAHPVLRTLLESEGYEVAEWVLTKRLDRS